MSKTTAPPAGDQANDATAAGVPVALDAIERVGATRFGVAVAELVITLTDGRRVRVELPAPLAGGQAGKDWAKTKPGAAILEVLAREGRPLKGAAIAANCRPAYRYNGSFRSALKGLEEQGLIARHDDDDGYHLAE